MIHLVLVSLRRILSNPDIICYWKHMLYLEAGRAAKKVLDR